MRYYIPETEGKFDQWYVDHEKSVMYDEHKFVIIVSCFSGATFISEDLDDYLDVEAILPKYSATCSFFGGGSVSVYEFNEENEVYLVTRSWETSNN